MRAAVPQFDPGKAAVGVDRVGGQGKRGYIGVIPQGQKAKGAVVGGGVDRAIFGADNAPAAFGLDPAQGSAGLRALPAKARGMRCLIEPVRGRDRADPDRLEQDGVVLLDRKSTRLNSSHG